MQPNQLHTLEAKAKFKQELLHFMELNWSKTDETKKQEAVLSLLEQLETNTAIPAESKLSIIITATNSYHSTLGNRIATLANPDFIKRFLTFLIAAKKSMSEETWSHFVLKVLTKTTSKGNSFNLYIAKKNSHDVDLLAQYFQLITDLLGNTISSSAIEKMFQSPNKKSILQSVVKNQKLDLSNTKSINLYLDFLWQLFDRIDWKVSTSFIKGLITDNDEGSAEKYNLLQTLAEKENYSGLLCVYQFFHHFINHALVKNTQEQQENIVKVATMLTEGHLKLAKRLAKTQNPEVFATYLNFWLEFLKKTPKDKRQKIVSMLLSYGMNEKTLNYEIANLNNIKISEININYLLELRKLLGSQSLYSIKFDNYAIFSLGTEKRLAELYELLRNNLIPHACEYIKANDMFDYFMSLPETEKQQALRFAADKKHPVGVFFFTDAETRSNNQLLTKIYAMIPEKLTPIYINKNHLALFKKEHEKHWLYKEYQLAAEKKPKKN